MIFSHPRIEREKVGAAAIVAELLSRGLRLNLRSDGTLTAGPVDSLTDADKALISAHRPDIVQFLGQRFTRWRIMRAGGAEVICTAPPPRTIMQARRYFVTDWPRPYPDAVQVLPMNYL